MKIEEATLDNGSDIGVGTSNNDDDEGGIAPINIIQLKREGQKYGSLHDIACLFYLGLE